MKLWNFLALLGMGSALCLGGCEEGTVPKGVTVQGVEVGGMEYSAAEELIRQRVEEELLPLTIRSPEWEVRLAYPVLSYTDNIREILDGAVAGESYEVTATRQFAEVEQLAEEVCRRNTKEAVDASFTFSEQGFSYDSGKRGVACDEAELIQDITAALRENREEVTIQTREFDPAITEEALRNKTRLISTFSTAFDDTNLNRTENIKLSASRLSGVVLEAGAEFSFNQTVGLRTEENGYRPATVIQNGVFAEGVGGGVCQTSTTLFNAALLAGMEITESRSHTLSIGYVDPSLDAMVSEYSDLKFRNPYSESVYLLSKVEGGTLTFYFYGEEGDYTYETESVTLSIAAPPAPEIVEGDEEKVIRAEKEGLTSESYLLSYDREGNLVDRKLIRKDTYATVRGIYQIRYE